MAKFQIEFNRKINLLDPVLAYWVLKITYLTVENEQLILATISDVSSDDMMIKVKKFMDIDNEWDKSTLLKEESVSVCIKHDPDITFTESCKDKDNSDDSELFYNTYWHSWFYKGSRNGRKNEGVGTRWNGKTRNFCDRRYNKKYNPSAPEMQSKVNVQFVTLLMHLAIDLLDVQKEIERDDKVHEIQIVLINLEYMDNSRMTLLSQTSAILEKFLRYLVRLCMKIG